MKVQRLFFTLLSAVLLLPAVSNAQTDAPPDVEDVPGTTAIPFDGLTTILLASGAAYAIKKGRKKERKNTD